MFWPCILPSLWYCCYDSGGNERRVTTVSYTQNNKHTTSNAKSQNNSKINKTKPSNQALFGNRLAAKHAGMDILEVHSRSLAGYIAPWVSALSSPGVQTGCHTAWRMLSSDWLLSVSVPDKLTYHPDLLWEVNVGTLPASFCSSAPAGDPKNASSQAHLSLFLS